MNKAFEKILDRLDTKKLYFQKFYETEGKTEDDENINKATQLAFDDAKNIVQEVAEEYKDGWIACSKRLPEDCEDVLVYFEYYRYGKFEGLFQTIGISHMSYVDESKWSEIVNGSCGWKDLRIIAWQPLPEPYQPKGEREA